MTSKITFVRLCLFVRSLTTRYRANGPNNKSSNRRWTSTARAPVHSSPALSREFLDGRKPRCSGENCAPFSCVVCVLNTVGLTSILFIMYKCVYIRPFVSVLCLYVRGSWDLELCVDQRPLLFCSTCYRAYVCFFPVRTF